MQIWAGEKMNGYVLTRHVLLLCIQHKTIESVLQRGEKLDNLVERSNALSMQSKAFYKTAKKVQLLSSSKSLLANHIHDNP